MSIAHAMAGSEPVSNPPAVVPENAVAVAGADEEQPAAVRAIEAALKRMKVRQDFVRAAKDTGLQKDVDYGVIPGCGDKPSLLKSGAEALAQAVTQEAESLFLGCGRFGAPRIEKVIEEFYDDGSDLFYYRVSIDLIGPSGAVLGSGVGSCNSREKKYREDRKGNERLGADSANTILKMAVKRAKVDCAIGVFGASSMFTQDIEDEAGDPLNRPIPFGKHEGKTWRELANDGLPSQRDSGASWLLWLSQNGKKDAERALAAQALQEAYEMRCAASTAAQQPPAPVRPMQQDAPPMARAIGDDLPSTRYEREPGEDYERDSEPAHETPFPPGGGRPASGPTAADRAPTYPLCTGEECLELRKIIADQATAAGLRAGTEVWSHFMDWTLAGFNSIAGGPVFLKPDANSRPTKAVYDRLRAAAVNLAAAWKSAAAAA